MSNSDGFVGIYRDRPDRGCLVDMLYLGVYDRYSGIALVFGMLFADHRALDRDFVQLFLGIVGVGGDPGNHVAGGRLTDMEPHVVGVRRIEEVEVVLGVLSYTKFDVALDGGDVLGRGFHRPTSKDMDIIIRQLGLGTFPCSILH